MQLNIIISRPSSCKKPTFATHTNLDDVGKFLQLCRDIPTLDLLSGENSMDVEAAMVSEQAIFSNNLFSVTRIYKLN